MLSISKKDSSKIVSIVNNFLDVGILFGFSIYPGKGVVITVGIGIVKRSENLLVTDRIVKDSNVFVHY